MRRICGGPWHTKVEGGDYDWKDNRAKMAVKERKMNVGWRYSEMEEGNSNVTSFSLAPTYLVSVLEVGSGPISRGVGSVLSQEIGRDADFSIVTKLRTFGAPVIRSLKV